MRDLGADKLVLKREIETHLAKLGLNGERDLSDQPKNKELIRALHTDQRAARALKNKRFVQRHLLPLSKYFACGQDIDPNRILPRLERIRSGTWQSDLFRLASMAWSIPVSEGYGRRVRYLVWDQFNGRLMGLIAIGDPVFNLRVRDQAIGWTLDDREQRLANVMDAYVLGAVPPYNRILVGKVIACLIKTRDVFDDFKKEYGHRVGTISQENKKARLLLVTTSSSLGRSSVYNRLKIGQETYLRSVGYTQGWGHFHISDDLFAKCRDVLSKRQHQYANGHSYQDGPNWKFRTIREALKAVGLPEDALFHGVGRQVFVSELASNACSILRGESRRPNLSTLQSVEMVGGIALDRWVRPRAIRDETYKSLSRDDVCKLIDNHSSQVTGVNGEGQC